MKLTDRRRVTDTSFPDPFVWRDGDRWFAIATGHASDGRVFPLMTSKDFVHWLELPGALEPLEATGSDYWAPEVALINGVWSLYYSVGEGDKGHHLRVARSSHPEGPYVDSGQPVLSPDACSFSIDAHPYQDDQGRWWLFYSRDLLDSLRPGTCIVVAPLEHDGTLGPDYTVVARADSDWQIYERGRKIYGQNFDWHTLEGPSIVEHNEMLIMFYSGGNWTNDSYGVDWRTATSVEGPWHSDQAGQPRFLRTGDGLIGPGHNSFTEGPDGKLWTAFHAWNETGTQREMWLARVDWS